MTVRGRLIGGVPFFPVWVRSKLFRGSLWLLADTGATRTTLLDDAVRSLDIPLDLLEPASASMAGIGGLARCFVVRDTEIRLGSGTQEAPLLQNIFVARHDLRGFSPAQASRILQLPSIMGRDIIDRFRFVYERATGTVLLER